MCGAVVACVGYGTFSKVNETTTSNNVHIPMFYLAMVSLTALGIAIIDLPLHLTSLDNIEEFED